VRVLLDTHTLIWSQDDPSKLPPTVIACLTDPANDRLVSLATTWEISVKIAIGKLALSKPYQDWLSFATTGLHLNDLPVLLNHLELQIHLPFHHRDPFDRLLICQALAEGLPILGGDKQFDTYGVQRIWD